MPDKILAIVPEDFSLGFKLTGVDTQACVSPDEARQYLEKELSQTQYTLLLIDEDFLLAWDNRLRKKIQESTQPLVMAIPLKKTFKEEVVAKDYFLKMVQDAIGYEIRIR